MSIPVAVVIAAVRLRLVKCVVKIQSSSQAKGSYSTPGWSSSVATVPLDGRLFDFLLVFTCIKRPVVNKKHPNVSIWREEGEGEGGGGRGRGGGGGRRGEGGGGGGGGRGRGEGEGGGGRGEGGGGREEGGGGGKVVTVKPCDRGRGNSVLFIKAAVKVIQFVRKRSVGSGGILGSRLIAFRPSQMLLELLVVKFSSSLT